jgi:hypothetical protein
MDGGSEARRRHRQRVSPPYCDPARAAIASTWRSTAPVSLSRTGPEEPQLLT